MAEYPRTVLEFRDWFADDAACRDYLAKLRWPEGFRCPICRGPDHWVTARGLRHCRGCGRQTLVTAGTLFADTHLPLRLWFEALWHVTSQKGGASALGLQRVLGLGSYRTAWNLLHKLRRAMVRPGRERPQGIEVDEIFIGGPRPGKRGRGGSLGRRSPPPSRSAARYGRTIGGGMGTGPCGVSKPDRPLQR